METTTLIPNDLTIRRKLVTVHSPAAEPGFLGAGHQARAVIQTGFAQSDPFIMLMDDVLDKKDEKPAGGPHPHAGFETVSLLIEGELGNGEHRMKAGDFQMMTAGSGIIHTETIDKKSRMRLLQMWLTLSKEDRWAQPRVQDMALESVPKVLGDGLEIRVYSGSLAGVTSPLKNHVPLILADIQLKAGVRTTLQLPASFNAFLYGIGGSVAVGEEQTPLAENQVGWLDRRTEEADSTLELEGGPTGGRVVLYAGQPQGDPIVSYGPFIGDTQRDIMRLYGDYHAGKMKHVSTLPGEQAFVY
ncbi:pirin family protein [Tellurirhabdus rosea]|uniref:pirin family protein n=1 Tax=Tellurirhabdus rosea TaxID=2674997 RepID=UPI0022596CE5|nr:pirin-like C-terminal cupin domain-containing protein [Tellurirhabdus rosea]